MCYNTIVIFVIIIFFYELESLRSIWQLFQCLDLQKDSQMEYSLPRNQIILIIESLLYN